MRRQTVVVGMSGGVDSSVAALLLKEQGYNVIGLFMHNWEEKSENGVCCAEQDFSDVKAIASKIDIPYYSVNFSKQYYDMVFSEFLQEYELGRTPNPDVLCNRRIKFGVMLDHAIGLGADFLATGHYCGVKQTARGFELLKAFDTQKDQSYFLNQLTQVQLSKAMFPLASFSKMEVREIARSKNFITHDKKDSTGICFIGERNFRKFLSEYLPAKEGEIRTEQGRVVGKHMGLMFYTLGQRKGLGLGGDSDEGEGRWFVTAKDLKNNILIVSKGSEDSLYTNSCFSHSINWIPNHPKDMTFECKAKFRYRQPDQDVSVEILDKTFKKAKIKFSNPQRAVTPGQYVVFYKKNRCIGGGVIETMIDNC